MVIRITYRFNKVTFIGWTFFFVQEFSNVATNYELDWDQGCFVGMEKYIFAFILKPVLTYFCCTALSWILLKNKWCFVGEEILDGRYQFWFQDSFDVSFAIQDHINHLNSAHTICRHACPNHDICWVFGSCFNTIRMKCFTYSTSHVFSTITTKERYFTHRSRLLASIDFLTI